MGIELHLRSLELELRRLGWLIKRWQYGTYGCNQNEDGSNRCARNTRSRDLWEAPAPILILIRSLFYKACWLHSKALPLPECRLISPRPNGYGSRLVFRSDWWAPLPATHNIPPPGQFRSRQLILELIKLIKRYNRSLGDLNGDRELRGPVSKLLVWVVHKTEWSVSLFIGPQ